MRVFYFILNLRKGGILCDRAWKFYFSFGEYTSSSMPGQYFIESLIKICPDIYCIFNLTLQFIWDIETYIFLVLDILSHLPCLSYRKSWKQNNSRKPLIYESCQHYVVFWIIVLWLYLGFSLERDCVMFTALWFIFCYRFFILVILSCLKSHNCEGCGETQNWTNKQTQFTQYFNMPPHKKKLFPDVKAHQS